MLVCMVDALDYRVGRIYTNDGALITSRYGKLCNVELEQNRSNVIIQCCALLFDALQQFVVDVRLQPMESSH